MSCAWETEYDTTGRSSPRLPHELYFEIGGPKPVGTAAQTASQTGKLFWVSRIKMAALMWTVVDTRTIARRSNKVRCFSVNSLAISRRWGIWQLSLATNSRPSLQRILAKSQ